MEQTFMTIHNLGPDANLLFVSDSVVDILGYSPDEIQGKSCFDFFHPDEVPFARSVHSRGVLLDKAAVLHYARIRARDGRWISCECCFTVVHDVLVACTSVYRRGAKSERRAIEAPQIRRIFSCSPRDPRYHMLEHLSPKFKMPPMEREPRAALILNRFTRTLTVMFATNAVSTILGVRPDQIKDKSFYECIQENCLQDAIKCLESAKANDSIAYLRFWYRDPRREEDFEDENEDENEGAGEGEGMDDEMDDDDNASSTANELRADMDVDCGRRPDINTCKPVHTAADPPPAMPGAPGRRRQQHEPIPSFELEAVVSCTSDGLVVVLRKARPPIPAPHPPMLPFDFENGLFAAPWGQQSITPYYPPEMLYTFRPPLLPQFMPLRENVKEAGGPPLDQLMKSIRDVAVFAWALVGINGNLAAYGRGLPMGEAQPDGLPIWDPAAPNGAYRGPENQTASRWAAGGSERGKENDNSGHNGHGFGANHHAVHGFANYTHSQPRMWPTQHESRLPSLLHQSQPGLDHHVPRQAAHPPSVAGYQNSSAPRDQWPQAEAAARFNQTGYNLPATQPSSADLPQPFYKWV